MSRSTGSSAKIDPKVWKIAFVAMTAPLLSTLDSTVVNVSLATLGHELHASLTTIQWVSSGYLLAMALALPLSGWLVDRYGARRMYLVCFTVFTLMTLLCGFAPSARALIAFRVIQGVAGGITAPLAQLVLTRIAGIHFARVLGISAMPVVIGPVFGPTLAGVVLQHGGWPWIFFITVPIGVLATLSAWRILPHDTPQSAARPFDLAGFLLLSPALVLFLHGLDRAGSASTTLVSIVTEFAAAFVLFALFLRHGVRRGKSALIDLALFRNRVFSVAATTQFFSNATLFGGLLLFPLYLLTAKGDAPSDAGILLAFTGIGAVCMYPIVGWLAGRYGPRAVSVTGAAVGFAGTLPFAVFAPETMTTPMICIALYIRGAGFGCITVPSLAAAYSSVARDDLPAATTAINIVQRLGGPVASTVLVLFFHASLARHTTAASTAFVQTFWLFCVIHALTFVSTLRLPRRTPQR